MTLHHGDCLEVMAGMDPESVDAVVTDPPYGLAFMGKHWDHGVPAVEFWREMLRVAKPSAYLLAFGGTRTVHRIATNIEDAGWIIRDMLVWGYASGFPKSKASLKPAWEPIVMARKPGPLRMLAIDECRIPFQSSDDAAAAAAAAGYAESLRRGTVAQSVAIGRESRDGTEYEGPDQRGRWPANIVLTDPIFDGGWDGVVGGGWQRSTAVPGSWAPPGAFPIDNPEPRIYGDSGTYSRFFLIPKAARGDREPVLGGLPEQDRVGVRYTSMAGDGRANPEVKQVSRANVHPTVKPTDLMRHLVRLVTPTGGIVLDPFLGSGTTALAAEMEGFEWIGIEREAEYVAIAEARLNGTQRGLGLGA